MEPETVFSAEVGDIVYFFRRQIPTPTIQPVAALVVAVGLNGRLELQTFNRVNPDGGGRDRSSYHGARPGDVPSTSDQLYISGSWMPKDVFNNWVKAHATTPNLTLAQFLKTIFVKPEEQATPESKPKK